MGIESQGVVNTSHNIRRSDSSLGRNGTNLVRCTNDIATLHATADKDNGTTLSPVISLAENADGRADVTWQLGLSILFQVVTRACHFQLNEFHGLLQSSPFQGPVGSRFEPNPFFTLVLLGWVRRRLLN